LDGFFLGSAENGVGLAVSTSGAAADREGKFL
jgi:hypothetical protein